jgi:hypothetical protein
MLSEFVIESISLYIYIYVVDWKWNEGEKTFPLKKRRGSSANSNDDDNNNNKMAKAKKKIYDNYELDQEDEDIKEVVVRETKQKKVTGALSQLIIYFFKLFYLNMDLNIRCIMIFSISKNKRRKEVVHLWKVRGAAALMEEDGGVVNQH